METRTLEFLYSWTTPGCTLDIHPSDIGLSRTLLSSFVEIPNILGPLRMMLQDDTGQFLSNAPDANTTERWINHFFRTRLNRHGRSLSPVHSQQSCKGQLIPRLCLVTFPSVLFFECARSNSIHPSPQISIPTLNRKAYFILRGIVYLGDFHFSARLLLSSDIWCYDGQLNDGRPFIDSQNIPLDIQSFGGKSAHVYIYTLEDAV